MASSKEYLYFILEQLSAELFEAMYEELPSPKRTALEE